MGIQNLTIMYMEQLGNPECSVLAGMQLNQIMLGWGIWRIALIYIGLKVIGKLLDIGYDFIKRKYFKKSD